MHRNKIKLQLFLVSAVFIYILFFTQKLPIFWEAHLSFSDWAKTDAGYFIKEIFDLTGNILNKEVVVFSLFFKLNFALFRYDFEWFRIAKAVIFTAMIFLIFKINTVIFTKNKYAFIATALSATSFPIYIHTMVFDEPFILAELLKLSALFLFLIDVKSQKKSFIRQTAIFIFSVLAFKTYTPAGTTMPILAAFLITTQRKLIKRYSIILIILFIFIAPFSSIITGKASGPFGTVFQNIPQVFIKDFEENILSPLKAIDFSQYTFRALYWKPLPNIITFFGFWTLILSILVIKAHKYFHSQRPQETPFKMQYPEIWRLCVIWIICELPIFISVPEPAIRYASAIITPLSILFISYVARAQNFLDGRILIYSKYFVYFAVGFIVMTNILNTFFFRALLGSDVIAMDKVTQIIEQDKNNCILYMPTYAEQYVIVDKTSKTYDLRTDIQRIQATKKDYLPERLKEMKNRCNRLFVVQQKAITRNVMFPPIDFSKYEHMKLVARLSGDNDSLFDKFYFALREIFGIKNLYNEYYLWEYGAS